MSSLPVAMGGGNGSTVASMVNGQVVRTATSAISFMFRHRDRACDRYLLMQGPSSYGELNLDPLRGKVQELGVPPQRTAFLAASRPLVSVRCSARSVRLPAQHRLETPSEWSLISLHSVWRMDALGRHRLTPELGDNLE